MIRDNPRGAVSQQPRPNRRRSAGASAAWQALPVNSHLLGAVLAGGASRRMGTDKAGVEISGATLLDRVASAVASVTDRVVVLGGEREGYESWPDDLPGSGPLAGVVTALDRMGEDRALVVAVDNAFVQARNPFSPGDSRVHPARRPGGSRRGSASDLRRLPEGDRRPGPRGSRVGRVHPELAGSRFVPANHP